MTTLPSLTEADIRIWTADASLSKGRAYCRDGSIINPRCQGDTLKAGPPCDQLNQAKL